ncbi:MAG: hypothetical protein NC102_03240 [Clostridium sp.]|nr:hypothetical protein [Clostridium sp.]
MNFANLIPAILGILGLSAFNKVDGHESLLEEECATLKGYGFSDRFLVDFKAYLKDPKPHKAEDKDKKMAAVSAVLGSVTKQLEETQAELDAMRKDRAADKTAHAKAIEEKEKEIEALNGKISALSKLPEQDTAAPAAIAATGAFNAEDSMQLGGMAGEHWSLSRPYNQRARAAMLSAAGMMAGTVPSPSSVDYETLRADLGAFYRTRWTDRLQTFLAELPSIADIFPMEAGHQDLDTLVNLFLGEFSQADTSGESDFSKVAKGSYEFGTETLRMYDVMFAHTFKSLKKLEKSWIGYLNREGSSPLKLSFIEYLLVETAKALHNEQQLRFVNGVRRNPEPDKPGRAMEAADGIYEYIRKRVEGYVDFTPNGGVTGKIVYQIKPFSLPRITPGNIGEVFYLGTEMIPSQFRDSGNVALYVPSFMIPWYHKYNEAHYGRNQDYKAGINYVKEFPAVKIVAIPNADNHHRIFWTLEGNIKTYTHISGEMLKFTIEQRNWSLDVWSNWKESIQAMAVGCKYTSRQDMDGSRQLIWCNDYDRPDTYFVEGDKDANPNAALHNSVATVANSSVFDITDIENAEVGTAVTIKCGAGGDNGVRIKKEGRFELIAADWTPRKGDTIRLMKRADGKFIEISRALSAADSYMFEPDETSPSVLGATEFIVGINTKVTAITDLADVAVGTVYTIYGAGEEYATTIANGGNFVLSEDIDLKSGSFIKLVKAEDGKFYEVARG